MAANAGRRISVSARGAFAGTIAKLAKQKHIEAIANCRANMAHVSTMRAYVIKDGTVDCVIIVCKLNN